MQPAALYNIAAWASFYHALAFNDITTGNNDYSPSGYSVAFTRRRWVTTWRAASDLPFSLIPAILPRARRSDVL